MISSQITLMAGLLILAGGGMIHADEARPLLHPMFSDHAVLQRDAKVTVWGWAKTGDTMQVSFAGQVKSLQQDRPSGRSLPH